MNLKQVRKIAINKNKQNYFLMMILISIPQTKITDHNKF